jgi:hypothetical protein
MTANTAVNGRANDANPTHASPALADSTPGDPANKGRKVTANNVNIPA